MNNKRLRKLLAKMNEMQLDRLVLVSKENLSYLFHFTFDTGKRISACTINSQGDIRFFVNSIFSEGVAEDFPFHVTFYRDGDYPIDLILQQIPLHERVGIDENLVSSAMYYIIQNRKDLTLSISDCVERLREIKDENEINALSQSARIADAVMLQTVQLQTYPTTEEKIAQMVVSFFDNYEVDEVSFTPIVASGVNTVNPHHKAGNTMILPNEPLLVDIGAKFNGYCSDMTRMFARSEIFSAYSTLYSRLLEAQQIALDIIRPGIELKEIDRSIRNYLKRYNLEQYFIHGTGHGIGIEAYELPYIHHNNTEIVKEGMVVTVGPGLYLQGNYGLRIEDVVLVTKTGSECLNKLPKELLILEEERV